MKTNPQHSVDRNVNEALKFNQETEMVPILGLISSQLNESSSDEKETKLAATETATSSIQNNHHPALLSLLADELSIVPEQIHDFEL